MYDNFEELLKITRERKIPIWKAVLEEESQLSESGEAEIIMEFQRRFAIMETSVKKSTGASAAHSREPYLRLFRTAVGLCKFRENNKRRSDKPGDGICTFGDRSQRLNGTHLCGADCRLLWNTSRRAGGNAGRIRAGQRYSNTRADHRRRNRISHNPERNSRRSGGRLSG